MAFATFGCKLNQWDTQNMLRLMAGHCDIVDFDREADVYVVNTCTVTAGSDYQARQLIRRTAREHPGATVVVTGCYAERARDELLSIEGVAEVVGNDAKEHLHELLSGYTGTAEPGEERAFGPAAPPLGSPAVRSRAHVAIQQGCDRRCAYCIVPSVRGPARSRSPESVAGQVRTLLDGGFREIVLTGTYLGDYGVDLDGSVDLPGLVEILDGLVDGAARLRISSLGPSEITEELIESMAGCRNVCRHFHVAFQSGDDGVLESMGRGHGGRELRRALELIADAFPDCGLGGDAMVGFPGEDDEAFSNTASVVREYPFSYLHVFVFSPRPGTAAATLGDPVHPRVAAQRSLALRELGAQKGLDFARRFVGRRVNVIAEGPSEEEGIVEGTSDEYLRVLFEGDRDWKGRLLPVDVIGVVSARRVSGRMPANQTSLRRETWG